MMKKYETNHLHLRHEDPDENPGLRPGIEMIGGSSDMEDLFEVEAAICVLAAGCTVLCCTAVSCSFFDNRPVGVELRLSS